MLGYAGGFVGPLAVGWTLDAMGGMSQPGVGAAFGVIAVLMLAALGAFIVIRPREVAGDRGARQPPGKPEKPTRLTVNAEPSAEALCPFPGFRADRRALQGPRRWASMSMARLASLAPKWVRRGANRAAIRLIPTSERAASA